MTPGIVNLAGLTLEYGKVLDEQGNIVAGGTSSLMQFQENAKRLSAATQSLETGFYSMLGALGGEGTTSVLGAIGKMSDNFIKGTSDFGKELDSLTDFVSFGIAPAFILFFWELKNYGKIGWAITLLFSV